MSQHPPMQWNMIISAETDESSQPVRMQFPDDLMRRFARVLTRYNEGKSSTQKMYRRHFMCHALTIGLTWLEVDPTMGPMKVRAVRDQRAHFKRCLDEIEAAANELQSRTEVLKQAIANLR